MADHSQAEPTDETTSTQFHALDADLAVQQMKTQDTGLDPSEAQRRLQQYGPNRLPEGAQRGAFKRFILQFHNLLIYVLIAAGALAAAIGHITDALVIAAVVLVNATIGFVQEGRANSAMNAIRAMIDPHASVLRGGKRLTIAADEVVQLYVRDLVGNVTRPVRELKGFRRIRLEPGETVTVEFDLHTDELAFHGRDMRLVAEPGEFHAWIGGSSDTGLRTTFRVVAAD
jgi:hypothetical protein